VHRRTENGRQDAEIIELYGKVAWLTIIIWSFYPIVWLFSEGFASFSVSFEVRGPSRARESAGPRTREGEVPALACMAHRLRSACGGLLI
jgi:hypothetical protein